MTFFVLPRSHSFFNILPSTSTTLTAEKCCSHSLELLYAKVQTRFDCLDHLSPNENKLNSKSETFNDLLEILNTINLFDSNTNLQVLHVGKNSSDTTDCVRIVRGLPSTYEVALLSIANDGVHGDDEGAEDGVRYDFLYIENESTYFITDPPNTYILDMLKRLMVALKHQREGGSCIMKIYHTVHRPIVEILYVLSFLYNKVSIVKPKTSNPASFDKYIVCKNFLLTTVNNDFYIQQHSKLATLISNCYLETDVQPNNIISLIDQSIPCYFINKMDDANVIIGQLQLEHMNQTISQGRTPPGSLEALKKQRVTNSSWSDKANFRIYTEVDNNKGNNNMFLQGLLKKDHPTSGKTQNGFLTNKKILSAIVDSTDEKNAFFYKGKFRLTDYAAAENSGSM